MQELAKLLDPEGTPKSGGGGRLRVRCPAHEDKNPSLTCWIDEKDKAAFNCHANCTHEEILGALDPHTRERVESTWKRPNVEILIPRRRHTPAPPRTKTPGNVEAEYVYTDEEGNTRYLVRRFPGKTLRQFRMEGGHIKSGRGDQPLYPYRLTDVMQAKQSGDLIYIVEGEKDADTLASHGLTATTNVDGAGKWKTEYNQWFQDARVVVIPDNDEPGHAHAQQVADSLAETADTVRILELPDLPDKGDVTDWLETHDPKELEELAHQALQSAPETPFGTIYTRSELANLPAPETIYGPYIVKGGVNMLYGRWGTAKSFLVLSWAASLTTGTPWNEHNGVPPQNVIYWAAEGQGGLHHRLQAWEHHHGTPVPDMRFRVPQRSPALDREETYVALAKLVEEVEAHHLMIDTLIRVKGTLRENEADELGGYLLTELAHQICDEYGCSITLVHHIGHEAKDRPRGSSSITDNLDALYEIRDAGGDIKALSVKKLKDQPMDAEPDYFELRQVRDSAVLVPTKRIIVSDDAKTILDQMRQLGPDGQWVTKAVLAAACGWSDNTLRTKVAPLIGKALDYEEGRGKPSQYRLIPENEPEKTPLEGAQNGIAHPKSELPDPF